MTDTLVEVEKKYKSRQYLEAIKLLENIIKKDPGNAMAYQLLAQCNFELNKPEEVLNSCIIALSINQGLYVPHILAGLIYLHRHQYNLSENEFKEAINVNPKDPIAYIDLGLVKFRENQFEESEAILKQAIIINSNIYEAHYYISLVYRKTKKYTQAFNELIKAYSIKPSFNLISQIFAGYLQRYRLILFVAFAIFWFLTLFLPFVFAIPILVILLLFATWEIVITFKFNNYFHAGLLITGNLFMIAFFIFLHNIMY